MENLDKWLIFSGIIIAGLGVLFWAAKWMGFPLGHLPGDVKVTGERWAFYFPIVTSIVLSVGLTIIINFILWLRR